jgi:hypothetical protein
MWRSRRPRRELRRDGPAEYRRGGPQVPMEEASAPGQRPAPSGSRRAATGVRNNRRVCSETVEDHDRRFWYRWPLTWRSSRAFTVLNTTQFHVRRPGTDLARRKPGVQIPSPPPHIAPAQGAWSHRFRRPSRVARQSCSVVVPSWAQTAHPAGRAAPRRTREQVAVAVEHEAGRGVPGPDPRPPSGRRRRRSEADPPWLSGRPQQRAMATNPR